MPDHPYGWWSLLPPLAAIVLAIITRRVILSLLAGVAIGALIVAKWNPIVALPALCETHLWNSLADSGHLRVFAFTLLMGAMVGVIYRSGGMHGVVELLAPLARSRRGGQLTTWLLGLVVFFDDYANTLLLGHTMRPLTDRLRISREKLAFVVDSTAAPVAGLAIVSTWVAGEIDYIVTGFDGLLPEDAKVNGLAIFVSTIPYRFYVLWMLLFVALVALLRRDFGAMLTAEQRAAGGQPSDAAEESPTVPGDDLEQEVPYRWYNAVVPILTVIVLTLGLLFVTGKAEVDKKVAEDPEYPATWSNIAGNGDSSVSLLYGSLSGLIVAVLLAYGQRILRPDQIRQAAFNGARLMLPALAILWLAWSLSKITTDDYLGTAGFLGGMLQSGISVAWMPTVVFLLSSAVAFATGTSWGTMGILMPLAVSVTYRMLADEGTEAIIDSPVLLASIGSVLAGAIFGDHCSPISDTTVLSSQASGCNHLAHVWTQLPYALAVGAVAVLLGTLPIGLGVSVWLMLPLGAVALLVLLLLLGRRVEETDAIS